MIESFHKDLQVKIKIILKTWPIGIEINNMADGHSKTVVKFELYEGKDKIQEKE